MNVAMWNSVAIIILSVSLILHQLGEHLK